MKYFRSSLWLRFLLLRGRKIAAKHSSTGTALNFLPPRTVQTLKGNIYLNMTRGFVARLFAAEAIFELRTRYYDEIKFA